jgi:hypothetical protein
LYNRSFIHPNKLVKVAPRIGKGFRVLGTSFCFVLMLFSKRWRPLEAALAAIGSQAEAVEECIGDERASGRDKPIDIEFLLSNVVPSVLNLSGIYYLTSRKTPCS